MGGWNASGRDNGSSYRAYSFRDCVPIVGETHQDYALFFGSNETKQELICGQRSSTQYYNLRRNSTYQGRTYIQILGRTEGITMRTSVLHTVVVVIRKTK